MEKLYKYDTHVHDKLCSACGRSLPEEMIEAYVKAGYSGICFTNHFFLGNTAVDRTLPWADFVTAYWDTYQRAKAYAAEHHPDFTVLFGIEHAYGGGKEVLTYGIDLEFLLSHPNLHEYSIQDYCDAVHAAGGYISHAHPFRDRPYIDMSYPLNPELWDAAEVYNHYNNPGADKQAEALAAEYGLHRTSGGDEHFAESEGIGKSGMAFTHPIRNEQEFVEALRRREGRCIRNGVIED